MHLQIDTEMRPINVACCIRIVNAVVSLYLHLYLYLRLYLRLYIFSYAEVCHQLAKLLHQAAISPSMNSVRCQASTLGH